MPPGTGTGWVAVPSPSSGGTVATRLSSVPSPDCVPFCDLVAVPVAFLPDDSSVVPGVVVVSVPAVCPFGAAFSAGVVSGVLAVSGAGVVTGAGAVTV